jgi:inhibitor of cysteine peptidase
MKSFALGLFVWLGLILPLKGLAANSSDLPVYTEDTTQIVVTAKAPQFKIRLKSNPTTGFSWTLKDIDARYVEKLEHHLEMPGNMQLMGAPGYEWWTFNVKKEAFAQAPKISLHFVYARPWEKEKPDTEITFDVVPQQ